MSEPHFSLADASPSPARARRMIVGLVLRFVASSLAVLPLLSHYRGDERFYTDGAIRMVQSGDWITPRYPDGRLRFRKPILPYWIVAVPFRALGVSVFTSRLGSLAMTAATLLLAGRLARLLVRDRRAAVLAVAILASNVQVMNLATRATTDALQAACATLALVGLAGALFDRDGRTRPRERDLACFWIGVGLVAASKGGLAIVLLAFAVAFVAWRGRRLGVRLRALLHWPAMFAALVLALGWFAAILFRHGRAAWAEFWTDQVGSRVQHDVGGVLAHVAQDAISIPTELLPWSLLIVIVGFGRWRDVRAFLAAHREPAWFVAGWGVILLVTFAGANIQRARYLQPTFPPVAAVASGLFVALWDRDAAARRRQRLTFAVLVIAAAVGSVALLLIGLSVDPLLAAGGGAGAAISVVAIFALRRFAADTPADAWRRAIVLCLFLLAASRANDLLTRHALYPAAGPAILQAIETHAPAGARIGAVGVAPGTLAQVRLLSAGRLEVDPLPDDASTDVLDDYDAIVVGEATSKLPTGFATASAGLASRGWRPTDVLDVALGRHTHAEVAARRGSPLVLAFRTTATTRATTRASHAAAPTAEDEDEN